MENSLSKPQKSNEKKAFFEELPEQDYFASPCSVVPCPCLHCAQKISHLKVGLRYFFERRFQLWMALYPFLIGLFLGFIIGTEIVRQQGGYP